MEHYAAIDVSLEGSSVCVVDAAWQIVREVKVRSEVQALVAFLAKSGLKSSRFGWTQGCCRSGCTLGWSRPGRPRS
jgi:transposase